MGARGHSRPGGAAVRTHRANAMVNPGEPGPTPDSPEKPATPAEGGAKPEENNGWFDNLWRKTQKDAEDTIKFIEEEHKKNVQKFEAAVDEIKTTAEEAVDRASSKGASPSRCSARRKCVVRRVGFFQAPTEPVRPPRRSLQRARLARVRRAALAQSTPPSNLPTLPFTPSSPPRPASSSRHRSSRLRLVASHAPPPASGRRRTPPRLPSRACR